MDDDSQQPPDLARGVAIAAIADGGILAGKVGEEDVLLFRSGQEVHAVGAACTHLGAPLAEGLGGFHWLSSRAFGETEIRSAASVLMFPGKGPSPEKLLSDYQMGLDIRPVRLPERGGYREGSRWDFLVRFDGLPLAATTLLLETENGSSEKFETNQQGIAHVTFPRDFDSASIDKEAGAARTRKGFAVSAVREVNGVRHSSAFNYFYTPDLMRERSLAWGMGFTLLGMCLAFPLLRRKETVHV